MKHKPSRPAIACYLLAILLWPRLCPHMLYMSVHAVVCIWSIEWPVIKVQKLKSKQPRPPLDCHNEGFPNLFTRWHVNLQTVLEKAMADKNQR